MKNSKIEDFVVYEYLAVRVRTELEPLYIDSYENFGWVLVNDTALVDREDYYINRYDGSDYLVNIRFKRDRRIKNKIQLMALQKKLDKSLIRLDKLQRLPNSLGVIWALIVGVVGIVLLVFSWFDINQILRIVCGVVGIVLVILPYFVYKRVKDKYVVNNNVLIEEEYNTIYDCCEQARKLICN